MRSTMSPISSADGKFHEGNVFNGELGTKVTALWLTENQDLTMTISEEIHSVLENANIIASPDDTAQLLQAIVKISKSHLRNILTRLAAESGLNLVAGSFEEGAITTNSNDVVWHISSNKLYGGVVGVVSENSLPSSVGWIDKTGATLKSALASEDGVQLVNGAISKSNLALQPVHNFESYRAENIEYAWRESIEKHGYVYLCRGISDTYTLAGTHTDLYSTTVIADAGVTLIVSNDQYPLLGSLKIIGNLIVKNAAINTFITANTIDKVSPVAKIKNNLLKKTVIAFDDSYAASVSGDVWTPISKGDSSTSAILVPLTIGSFTGIFVPICSGEAISAHQRVESGSASAIGVVLRCSNGWVKIVAAVGSSNFSISYKIAGSSEVGGVTLLPIDSNLLSGAAGNSALGVALKSSTQFLFLINGTSKVPISLVSGLGDILDVGFIFDGVVTASVARVTGLCCYKADKSLYGYGPLHISIYGDSTADAFAGSFDKYLPQLLDGENASRSISIENYAISGQSFQQQLSLLKANGPGNAYVICMVAGTNDIQFGTSADDFAAEVSDFIDYCEEHNRIPMLVEPWLWYPSSMIGGAGQPSHNYHAGSELREAGKRVALGRGAIYVSTTHELPSPSPSYYNSGIDPLLRDDIHQSQLGYRLYAELIASHIIDYMGRFTKNGISIPVQWKSSSVTSISNSSVKENGFSGAFKVSGFVNGSSILSLPRWVRPPRALTIPATFTTSGGALAACYAVIGSDGVVTVSGLTQTSSTIVLSVNW